MKLSKILLILLIPALCYSSNIELSVFNIITGSSIIAASVYSAIYMPDICRRHGEFQLATFVFYSSIFTASIGAFQIKIGFGYFSS